jgi:hypothetical protein
MSFKDDKLKLRVIAKSRGELHKMEMDILNRYKMYITHRVLYDPARRSAIYEQTPGVNGYQLYAMPAESDILYHEENDIGDTLIWVSKDLILKPFVPLLRTRR